jgi:hypothetical protein
MMGEVSEVGIKGSVGSDPDMGKRRRQLLSRIF